MTTNSNPDTFAETMERQHAQALMTQLRLLMDSNDLDLVKKKHIEALEWMINDHVQMKLMQSDGGKA